jgi:tetratricopeptide (TPR) repeat protein
VASNRFLVLQQLLKKDPGNPLARYGVAMEYAKRGEFDKALETFQKLWELHPDYAAAYYHGGQLLVKMGKLQEAREVYQRGIEVTIRIGDQHTQGELQMALEEL